MQTASKAGQDVLIDNGDAAEHGTYDAEKSLVGSGEKEVVISYVAILDFHRIAVYGTLFFCGETFNGQWCKRIMIYNVFGEITNDFLGNRQRVPDKCLLGRMVGRAVLGKLFPLGVIGQMGGANFPERGRGGPGSSGADRQPRWRNRPGRPVVGRKRCPPYYKR